MATKKVTTKKVEPDYSEFEAIADEPDYSEFEAMADDDNILMQSVKDTYTGLKTVGGWGLEGLKYAAEKKEKYLDAPFRQTISDTIEGKPITGLISGLKQIGGDPKQAPTGAQIASQLGVKDQTPLVNPEGTTAGLLKEYNIPLPTKQNIAGLGVEFAADPLFFGKPITGAIKTVGGITKGLIKGASKVGDLALGEGVISRPVEATGRIFNAAIGEGFNPIKTEYADKMINTAKSIGIPEEELSAATKYGPESLLSQTERATMQSPAGKDIVKTHQQTNSKITKAIYEEIDDIAPPTKKSEVGEIIRYTVKDAQDKLLKDVEGATMAQASKKAPLSSLKITEPKKPTVFEEMKAWITNKPIKKELPKRPYLELDTKATTPLQQSLSASKKLINDELVSGRSTLAAGEISELDKVVKIAEKAQNYDDAVKALKQIGKVAFDDIPKATRLGQVSAPKEEVMKLYFGLQDAIIGTIRSKISPELADSVVKNNIMMTSFFRDRNLFMDVLENAKVDGEAVFNKLVGPGKSQNIKALKNILPDETFNELSSTYINSLIKKNATGELLYASTLKNIESKKDFLLNFIPEKKLEKLINTLELGVRQGADKLNTSGTQISEMINKGLAGLLTAGRTRTGYEMLKKRAAKESGAATPIIGKGGYIGPQAPSRFENSVRAAGLINRYNQQKERE